MKYWELNIGDWFTDITGGYWIKTNFNGKNYTLDMGDTRLFGALGIMPENTEVDFVSRLTVENPTPFKKGVNETLFIAPTFQFLSCQPDNREIILMKALIQGEIYMLTINGNNAGVWTQAIPRISVKVIPRIDLKCEENS